MHYTPPNISVLGKVMEIIEVISNKVQNAVETATGKGPGPGPAYDLDE